MKAGAFREGERVLYKVGPEAQVLRRPGELQKLSFLTAIQLLQPDKSFQC